MKRMFLGLLLAASVAMADMPTSQDDLLSVATAGKTTGTQFEMSKEDMKDAEGGWSYTTIKVYGNPYNVYYPSYSSYWYKGYHTISIRNW